MLVRISSSNTVSPIALFPLSLLLLALPSHLREAYAHEDDGVSTATETEKIDLTPAKDVAADNFQDVLSACKKHYV